MLPLQGNESDKEKKTAPLAPISKRQDSQARASSLEERNETASINQCSFDAAPAAFIVPSGGDDENDMVTNSKEEEEEEDSILDGSDGEGSNFSLFITRRQRQQHERTGDDSCGNSFAWYSLRRWLWLLGVVVVTAIFLQNSYMDASAMTQQEERPSIYPSFFFHLPFLAPTIDTTTTSTTTSNTNNKGHHLKDSPTQIHLAYTKDPSIMLVQFVTDNNGKGNLPVALYGHDSLTTKVQGTTTTYEPSDMCGSPANDTKTSTTSGQLHSIELTNLKPDTTYNYKVGLTFGQGIVWSSTFEFTSAPASTSSDDEKEELQADSNKKKSSKSSSQYTYAVYGAGKHASKDNLPYFNPSQIRSVHYLGNLANAKGEASIWDDWMTAVSDAFASRIPLMVVVGNQDYDYHKATHDSSKDPSGATKPYHPTWGNFDSNASGGECGVPMSKRFTMPSSSSSMGAGLQAPPTSADVSLSNGVFWYSYQMGPVFTIVLSSEHDLSPGSKQYKFLKHELEQTRKSTTWTIIELHRPLYHPLQHHWKDTTVGIAMRMELESLWRDHNVDLILSGHSPAYSRSCAGLYQSTCHSNGKGPTHITVGGTSNKKETYTTYKNDWTKKFISGELGYGRITVNSTNLLFEYVRATFQEDDKDPKVLDKVRLSK